MTKKRYFFYILILGTLTAIGPFSIDMYLPGFPAIAKDLKTTIADVSLSLSSFFVGISVGQLLYGPLLDRYGRKTPLYFGLILYIITSLGCLLASSIETLIVMRFIQAVGSCAAAVASVAMVRDIFPVNENAKVFSLLMLVVGVSPMIAPTVGGYMTSAFGWHSVFIVLAVITAIVLVAVYFVLPESSQPDPTYSLKPKPILKKFLSVLKEPQFLTYALTGGIAFAGLFAYVSGSPMVFMEIFGVNEKQYGWIFAFLSIGLIGASQVNSLLLRRYKSEQIIVMALLFQSFTGIVFVSGTISGFIGLPGTIALIFVFLCCTGLTFPNASALSLVPFTKNAGSASALMGAIQMGLGALISIAVSIFNNQTALPMAVIMALCSIIAYIVLLTGRRMIPADKYQLHSI